MRQHSNKRDLNEPLIRSMLTGLGATVYQVNEPALPDLVAVFPWGVLLVEVKMPGKKLTPRQIPFHDKHSSNRFVGVVYGAPDAARLVHNAHAFVIRGAQE